MAVTELTAQDIALTKSEEGFVPYLYHDVVGVATIGYGTTLGAGVVNPLPESCTEEQATIWLLEYMNRSVVPAILETGFQPANGCELGGLADLGYNTGAGVFGEGHTMGNALRTGNRDQIAAAFMVYVYAGDQVLSDLVHRREADRALFLEEPPHVPTYHYDWYAKFEQNAVERYDALSHTEKPSRLQKTCLATRRKQCGALAWALARKARSSPIDGKPSWGIYHRGWRHVELAARGSGKVIQPT